MAGFHPHHSTHATAAFKWAAREGAVDLKLYILDTGARFNMAEALWDAVARGDEATIRMLIMEGVGLTTVDATGRTPLQIACCNGQVECARILVGRGASVLTVDDWGRTALHMAADDFGTFEHTSVSLAKLLLGHGADVNVLDNEGETATDYATTRGCSELVALLKAAQNKERRFTTAPTYVNETPSTEKPRPSNMWKRMFVSK